MQISSFAMQMRNYIYCPCNKKIILFCPSDGVWYSRLQEEGSEEVDGKERDVPQEQNPRRSDAPHDKISVLRVPDLESLKVVQWTNVNAECGFHIP